MPFRGELRPHVLTRKEIRVDTGLLRKGRELNGGYLVVADDAPPLLHDIFGYHEVEPLERNSYNKFFALLYVRKVETLEHIYHILLREFCSENCIDLRKRHGNSSLFLRLRIFVNEPYHFTACEFHYKLHCGTQAVYRQFGRDNLLKAVRCVGAQP